MPRSNALVLRLVLLRLMLWLWWKVLTAVVSVDYVVVGMRKGVVGCCGGPWPSRVCGLRVRDGECDNINGLLGMRRRKREREVGDVKVYVYDMEGYK